LNKENPIATKLDELSKEIATYTGKKGKKYPKPQKPEPSKTEAKAESKPAKA